MSENNCPKPNDFKWLLEQMALENIRGIGQTWYAIPQHLIFFSVFLAVSLVIYYLRGVWQCRCEERMDKDTPSLYDLVRWRADVWLRTKKGTAVFNYIGFQRLMVFLSCVTFILSTIVLVVHVLIGRQNSSPFDMTTITSLMDGSAWKWIHVGLSCVLPWVVAFTVREFISVQEEEGGLKQREASSALVIEGLDPEVFTNSAILELFNTTYPNFRVMKVTRAQDTRQLRRLVFSLDWNKKVIQELVEEGDQISAFWCDSTRDLTFFHTRVKQLKKEIETIQDTLRREEDIDKLRIVFIILQTRRQAQTVAFIEQLKHDSPICTIQEAPFPDDIAWENMRSQATSFFLLLGWLVLLTLVCSLTITPAAFAKQFEEWPEFLLKVEVLKQFRPVVSTMLFMLFSLLMAYIIKLWNVKFGNWSKIKIVENYMTRLFIWLLVTVVLFPLLLLGNLGDIIFLFSGETGGTKSKGGNKHCLYNPRSGAFFINYLVVSSLMRCQLQLHRLGDFVYQMWMVLVSCRSRAERKVAYCYAQEYCRFRNTGENMGLCEDYVWILVHYAIQMCFCFTSPLISVPFSLYLGVKHLVDLQNFRLHYSAKVDQPVLFMTAVKLTIFCPLLAQGNVATNILWGKNVDHTESNLGRVSAFLLLLNMFLMLVLHSTDWRFPVRLFMAEKTRVERGDRGLQVFRDPLRDQDIR